LQLAVAYSENLHRRETVERVTNRFVGSLRELIKHCRDVGVGGHTPSDFPLAKVDQAWLDKWTGPRASEVSDES
jgi:non-ribosomal peptide synthase protein (TIGR01720 family)